MGRTLSGKTTLAAQQAAKLKAELGRPLIVLDPNLDPRWQADFITHDAEKFLQVVKQSERCIVVVDESGESIGRYASPLEWLATRGRHWGHMCFFIGQRATQISKNVRTQCANVFIFRQAQSDAQVLAAEYADSSGLILQAAELQQGEFIACVGFNAPKKFKLW